MVKELEILPNSTTDISLASFGSASRHHQKLVVTTVEVKTDTGEQIPISALIVPMIAVPMIAAPIQNATPVTVRAKILFQQIWQTKLTWDEPLPKEMAENRLIILPQLIKLPQFTIP